MAKLTKEELLALDSVLVRDNNQVDMVRIIYEYTEGRGFEMESPRAFVREKYLLSELDGKEFPTVKYDGTVYEIRAVVEDTVYIIDNRVNVREEFGGGKKFVYVAKLGEWHELYTDRQSCYGEHYVTSVYVNPYHIEESTGK